MPGCWPRRRRWTRGLVDGDKALQIREKTTREVQLSFSVSSANRDTRLDPAEIHLAGKFVQRLFKRGVEFDAFTESNIWPVIAVVASRHFGFSDICQSEYMTKSSANTEKQRVPTSCYRVWGAL